MSPVAAWCAWCTNPPAHTGPAGLALCAACHAKARAAYRVGVVDGRAEALPIVRAVREYLETIGSRATKDDGTAEGDLVLCVEAWAETLDLEDQAAAPERASRGKT